MKRHIKEKEGMLEHLKGLEEGLKPVEDRLKEIHEVERDYAGIYEKLGNERTSAKHYINEVQNLRNVLKNDEMSETADEIETLKDEMKYEERKFMREKETLDSKLDKIKAKINQENLGIEKIQRSVQQCQFLKNQNENQNREVKNLLASIGKTLEWPTGISFESPRKIEEAMDQIEDTKTSKEKEKVKIERDFDEKIEAQIDLINELTKDKASLEAKQETMRSSRSENNRKLAGIKRILSNLEGSTQKIQKLREQLEVKDANLTKLKSEINVDTMETEISEKSARVQSLEKEVKALKQELKSLENLKDLSTNLNMKTKDFDLKKSQIKKILNKHRDDLEKIFDVTPNIEDLKRNFNKIDTEIANQKSTLEQKTMKNKSKLENENDNLEKLLEDVKNGELKIKNFEKKLGNLNSIDSFDANLEEAKENVVQIRDELQVKEANKHSFKQFIEKMTKNETCPTCQRGFKNAEECQEVIEFLKDEIEKVPTKVKYIQKRLDEAEKIQKDLEKMIPEKSRCLEIRNDLETKNEKISDSQELIQKLKQEVKKDEKVLEELDDKCQAALNIREDVVYLDNLNKEVKILEKSIHEIQTELNNSGANTSKNYDEIQNEYDLKSQELDTLREDLEVLRSKRFEYESKLNRLQSERNSIFNEKLTLEQGQQERVSTEKDKVELEQKIKDDDLKIESILKELKPIGRKMDEAKSAKYDLEKSKEIESKKILKFIETIKDEQKTIENVLNAIKDYDLSGNEDKLDEFQRQVQEAKQDLQAYKLEEDDLNNSLNRVAQLLNSQESRKRCLEDNLKLKEYKKRAEEHENQIKKFETQLRDLNLNKVDAEKKKLKEHIEQLEREKFENKGRMSEMTLKISDLDQELKEDRLANAAERFRKTLVQKCTEEKVIKDLNTYYIALDWAIMRYHKEKMKRINQTMKLLWRQTYRGNDIDSIEIKTDDGEVVGGADKRKSYNYRVVMNKGKSELEMRGRCSAGQKVLASLIIRLALAETFSANCGIIALDEPTTNLDRENIGALAEALGQLVVARADTNFQLIVITHDDELLDHLGKVDRVDHYYKIWRNSNGYSVIHKKSVHQ